MYVPNIIVIFNLFILFNVSQSIFVPWNMFLVDYYTCLDKQYKQNIIIWTVANYTPRVSPNFMISPLQIFYAYIKLTCAHSTT
jgi:hypothetical protein